jgi:hypothetical protein
VTLGLETGWSSSARPEESRKVVWVGGRGTPLVTVHLPLLDVGVIGAAAWDRGQPGVLAGFTVQLIL